MRKRPLGRLLAAASLVAAGLVASTGPASAVFHEMKVVEVFAATADDPNIEFVELQMFSPGQNSVGGHRLHFYGEPSYPGEAAPRTDCTIPDDVGNGADNAHILFGTTEAQAAFGTADFTMPPLLSGTGGAVCFENIDCVSWGSFAGATTSPSGMPEPGGIPSTQSLHRDLKGNTTLEPADDTNDSATDFSPGPESATANGPSNLGTLTCQAGGSAGAGGYRVANLRARVTRDRAIITGRIEPPAAGHRVKLTFLANGSPLRKIARKSATLNADSRFKKSFRVPTNSTRCRVKVAFEGAPMGKKTFRC
ncbi:MAG TPA: hypothetical protein VE737_07060 [Actinomycetota bacterium]|nr:hypothetical protein [Actinomycetota bacterium]